MRKLVLAAFVVAIDGLAAILFGLVAFAVATVLLGLMCAYVYRMELASACRFVLGKSNPPWGGTHAARNNPGGGIHIAKLLSKAKTRSEADEILDVFIDAPTKVNEGAAYAAYAGALVRFGDLINVEGALISAKHAEGRSNEE